MIIYEVITIKVWSSYCFKLFKNIRDYETMKYTNNLCFERIFNLFLDNLNFSKNNYKRRKFYTKNLFSRVWFCLSSCLTVCKDRFFRIVLQTFQNVSAQRSNILLGKCFKYMLIGIWRAEYGYSYIVFALTLFFLYLLCFSFLSIFPFFFLSF